MDFSQIAILLVCAGFFGIIAKLLRQPLLIGYLFAGFFLTSTGILQDSSYLQDLGKIGVTLLLFLLGMDIKIHEFIQFGKTTLVSGLGQIVITSLAAFILALLLGVGIVPSFYIALALSFSSTIIVVKLLSEKKDLSSFYGRLSVGILLVQDVTVILLLLFLSGLNGAGTNFFTYLLLIVKAVGLLVGVWFLSKKLLPHIFEKFIASPQELLFVGSIAWALGFALLVAKPLGFTLEIGGFLAGLALSNLPEHTQIASKTRPLRDFFLVIFFLYLGGQLAVDNAILSRLPFALLFSLFVTLIKPLIVVSILGYLGFKKRTSLLAGISLSQISEFSLILVSLGSFLGHISREVASIVILCGIITMTVSTYTITYADKIINLISKYFSFFEREKTHEQIFKIEAKLSDHIILAGCDRTGRNLVDYFTRRHKEFLVIDFNPKVFTALTAQNVPVVFGDAGDPEILEEARISKAKLIISTIGNLTANLQLLKYAREVNENIKTVFTASLRSEALKLYEEGASYVIVPEVVAGEHIRVLIRRYGVRGEGLVKAGQNHFNRLIFS